LRSACGGSATYRDQPRRCAPLVQHRGGRGPGRDSRADASADRERSAEHRDHRARAHLPARHVRTAVRRPADAHRGDLLRRHRPDDARRSARARRDDPLRLGGDRARRVARRGRRYPHRGHPRVRDPDRLTPQGSSSHDGSPENPRITRGLPQRRLSPHCGVMTTTLITGANKGLGKETARRLLSAGHTVYLGARAEERGRAAAEDLGARFVRIDVTDEASVNAAAEEIARAGGLDVLINNAGIEPRLADNKIPTAADETPELMTHTFATNAIGTLRLLHTFLPLLERSSAPVVVNLSSGLASISGLADPASHTHFYPGISYPASKAVVNAITVQYAKQYPWLRINAVEPGFTDTALNGHTGTQTVAEGAEIIVQMAQVAPDGPTGTYRSIHGPIPWRTGPRLAETSHHDRLGEPARRVPSGPPRPGQPGERRRAGGRSPPGSRAAPGRGRHARRHQRRLLPTPRAGP